MAVFGALTHAQEPTEQTKNASIGPEISVSAPSEWVAIVLPKSQTPQELHDFVLEISKRQPSYRPQYLEVQAAIKSAAEQALAANPGPSTQLTQEFERWLVSSSVQLMSDSGVDDRRIATERLLKHLQELENPSSEDLQLALLAGQSLEQLDELSVAKKAYQDLITVVESKQGEQYGVWIDMLKGSLNRLNSLGKIVEFKAKTLSGADFDLHSLKGKFVLLYFWATWDRVTPTDYPNLEHTYKTYHDLGLEVVSVSMDTDHDELESFLLERKTPWTVVWDGKSDWQQRIVARFGITAIPTSMLLDREGKVIHLDARGAVLEKLLNENLVKPDPAPMPNAKPKQ